jgi:Glu-tRNA(Gln) amidotransferase subunit E-like FAD-binding protein
MSNIDNILSGITASLPHLTLGDLIAVHQLLDREICRQLALAPISDTMDLRSANIRKEVYSFDESEG